MYTNPNQGQLRPTLAQLREALAMAVLEREESDILEKFCKPAFENFCRWPVSSCPERPHRNSPSPSCSPVIAIIETSPF